MVKSTTWCCENMKAEIELVDYPPTPFMYNPYFREYSIFIPNSASVFCINFCPMCGSKLPASLRKQWYAILRTEFHLNPNDPDDEVQIPQEFLSDEWWKKRGL